MAQLNFSLLGRFEVALNGRKVTSFGSDRARALLAYLAMDTGAAPARAMLGGLLWPQQPEDKARTNLRDALRKLRLALREAEAEAALLVSDMTTIQLSVGPHSLLVDAVDFAQLSVAGPHDHTAGPLCPSYLDRYTQAAALYQGDFLAGLILPDNVMFEAWARTHQEQLHIRAMAVLYRLASHHEFCGEYQHAIDYARRQLNLEPWREEAHQQIMRAYALSEQRSAALAQYDICRAHLQQELGVPPSPETEELYRRIREGEFQRADAPLNPPLSLHGNVPPRHNLPASRSALIGRGNKIEQIRQHLAEGRLVTLVGLGGLGKTRLALEAAAACLDDFPDGVWLVELSTLTSPAQVPEAMAAALRIQGVVGRSMEAVLVDYLRHKSAMLVVDNCEHMLAACATLIEPLLNACAHLKIMVTSREPLNLTGEWVWPVPRLTYPTKTFELAPNALPAEAIQYESVQLFVTRATAVNPSFALSASNAGAVMRICQRLDGMPLALELAAARAGMLSAHEIDGRLGDRFALLTHGTRTAMPRHRTLQATLDWSYNLLSEPEQALFSQLAVFANGFTLSAVEGVVRVPDPAVSQGISMFALLSLLVDKSLVTASTGHVATRYSLLETVREYARGKLEQCGDLVGTRQRHLMYFVGLAEDNEPGRKNGGEVRTLSAEKDNLIAAMETSLKSDDAVGALKIASSLSWYWWIRGYLGQQIEHLQRALAQPAMQSDDRALIRAKALTAVGSILTVQGCFDEARRVLEAALDISTRLDETRLIGLSLRMLGPATTGQGDYAAARAYLERGIGLWKALGDRWHTGWLLAYQGDVALLQHEFDEAKACYAQSVLHLESKSARTYSIRRLGYLALRQGRTQHARALFVKSLDFNASAEDTLEMVASIGALACLCVLDARTGLSAQAEDRAAVLFGLMDALLSATGSPLRQADGLICAEYRSILRKRMGGTRYQHTLAQGRRLSIADAIALTHEARQEPVPLPPKPQLRA